MTLLVDPPLLFGGGYAIGRSIDDQRAAHVLGLGLAATVLAVSVATYRDSEMMRPVWTRLGARTGRDLIVNSWGVLRFDSERTSPRRTAVVAALFASYPLWARLGVQLARARR